MPGVVIYIHKKHEEQRAELSRVIDILGGDIRWQHCSEVTHFIYQVHHNLLRRSLSLSLSSIRVNWPLPKRYAAPKNGNRNSSLRSGSSIVRMLKSGSTKTSTPLHSTPIKWHCPSASTRNSHRVKVNANVYLPLPEPNRESTHNANTSLILKVIQLTPLS